MFEPLTTVSFDDATHALLRSLYRLATEGGPLVMTAMQPMPDGTLKFILVDAKNRLCAFASNLSPESRTKVELYDQADAQEILREYFEQNQ